MKKIMTIFAQNHKISLEYVSPNSAAYISLLVTKYQDK